jgi:hypothetical protein
MRNFLLIACLALVLSAAGCREPQFLAVGHNGFTCRSPDGIAWKPGRFGTDMLTGIAYGSGMYMLTAYNRGVFSTADGIHWSMQVTDKEHFFDGIAYGGGKFVVLSAEGPTWYYDNETYWHQISYSTETTGEQKISYAAGRFMIATDTGIHYTATPGSVKEWHYVRILPETQSTGNLSAVAGDDTTLIVADVQGHAYYAAADNFTSPSSWTQVDIGAPQDYSPTVTHGKHQGTDTFLLGLTGALKKSTDEGRTWQDVTPENFMGAHPTAGIYHDGQFLLCGPNMGIYRSADGAATWEEVLHITPDKIPLAIAASTGN